MTRWIFLIFALLLSTSVWAQVIGGGGALTVGVTPVLGTCTSGDFLYNNSGKLGCSVPGGTPGGSTLQLQYNNAGAFGGMAGTSWDNANRSLTITGATVTTSKPVLDISQTWNNAATTFKGVLINITNTASTSSSDLLDVQLGGASFFRINRLSGVVGNAFTTGSQFILPTNGIINFGDVYVKRAAAATLQLGLTDSAAPVAQTLGVQNVVAGTTDTNGVNFTIKGATSTGSGVAGDIILQTGGTGAGATAQNAFSTGLTVKGATQAVIAANSVQTTCTTVTGLGAAGTAGRNWCVTDQLTACPALGGTFTGGGAVVCKAFDDGTNWTHQ